MTVTTLETDLVWTRAIVRERIREALINLRRMKLDPEDMPAGLRTISLERNYRPDFDDAFAAAVDEVAEKGAQAPPRVRLGPPDPIAIDRMYEAIEWLYWLNNTQRAIVSRKALNRAGNLPRLYRKDRTTINRWHNHSLDRILRRLIAEGVRVREAEG